jgi:hypothetical protein
MKRISVFLFNVVLRKKNKPNNLKFSFQLLFLLLTKIRTSWKHFKRQKKKD